MKPKKSKEFIKETSEELNIKEHLVQNVIDFYWKNIRINISNLEFHSINVANLGTFKVRSSKIKKIKKDYNRHLDILSENPMTFDKHTIKNRMTERLNKIEIIEKQIANYHNKKLEKKKLREEYINNKNLESKESDS